MNKKLLQDTINFITFSSCESVACEGPTMKPKTNTCRRCALLARLLKAQKTYKPRAKRQNLFLNLTKEV